MMTSSPRGGEVISGGVLSHSSSSLWPAWVMRNAFCGPFLLLAVVGLDQLIAFETLKRRVDLSDVERPDLAGALLELLAGLQVCSTGSPVHPDEESVTWAPPPSSPVLPEPRWSASACGRPGAPGRPHLPGSLRREGPRGHPPVLGGENPDHCGRGGHVGYLRLYGNIKGGAIEVGLFVVGLVLQFGTRRYRAFA